MKDKFKTEERQQLIIEKKQTVKPLGREIRVFVEKVRPVFEGSDGERRGPPRVKIVLSRGKGFVALTPAEAAVITDMIAEVLEPAIEAEKTCEEEKKAWVRREDEKSMYQPGPGVGILSSGKDRQAEGEEGSERESQMKPDRVVFNLQGEATTPQCAKDEHGVEPTVIFERDDGWTLGAPESLSQVAESLWTDKWVAVTWKKPNGKWERRLLVADPERPWTMPSIARQVFKKTRIPITRPDEVVAIAKQLVKRLEEFPVHMHPNHDRDGAADIKEYWQPLVRQLCVLREAIEELEK